MNNTAKKLIGNRPTIHLVKVRCADYTDARGLCTGLENAGIGAMVVSPRTNVSEVHFIDSIDNQTVEIMREFDV